MKPLSSVSASWILPVSSKPIQKGTLHFSDKVINKLQTGSQGELHFEGCTILPGLINTHCHLELGMLKGKTRERIPFTEWADELKALITPYTMYDFLDAVEAGLQHSLECGTTTIADVGFSGANISSPKNHMRLLGFKELLGMDPMAAERIIKQTIESFTNLTETSVSKISISAHAPFSCSQPLIKSIIDYNHRKGSPFIMHLSESREENEHFSGNNGLMSKFLKSKYSDYELEGKYKNSVDYCLSHNLIPDRSLLIHVNHITPNQLKTLTQKQCSITHCPRSRAFFNHKDFPFEDALNTGINLTLGTDSLASNYSLNMWEEISYLYSRHSLLLTPEKVIEMATINGAKALFMDPSTGSLDVGKLADFIVVEPSVSTGNPYLDIVQQPPKVKLVVVNGTIVFQK